MKKILFSLLVFLISIMPLLVNAQPPPPTGTTEGNSLAGPSGAPIGGGTSILFLLAIAYGSVKVYQSRKKDTVETLS